MKSIILIYKQRNLLCYVKKSITEKNTLLFTVHSYQLFLISINQKHIYFSLNKNSININITLKGHPRQNFDPCHPHPRQNFTDPRHPGQSLTHANNAI